MRFLLALLLTVAFAAVAAADSGPAPGPLATAPVSGSSNTVMVRGHGVRIVATLTGNRLLGRLQRSGVTVATLRLKERSRKRGSGEYPVTRMHITMGRFDATGGTGTIVLVGRADPSASGGNGRHSYRLNPLVLWRVGAHSTLREDTQGSVAATY